MQVNSQKRENTKTTILALLLAHKTGCTLRQLNNDYYESEGENIPWKDLGYVSLLDFLNSMPKTVQVEHNNNVIIVRGIASDKSIHVSKLIAGQKAQKYPIKRKVFKPSHYYPKTAPQRIIIPAEILSRIISLVNNHPDGVNKDYIFHKVQSCMPFTNITLRDMEEQLQELSHKVCLMNNKIYPVQSKSKNFNHFKKADDMSFSKCKFASHDEQENKSVIVTVAGNEDSDMSDDNKDVFELQPFNDTSGSFYINSTETAKPTTSFRKETTFKYQDDITSHTSITQDKQSNSHKSFNCNDNVQIQIESGNTRIEEGNCSHKENVEILINERIKFRLEKLIQNHPEGIWCADLPDRYLEEYKISLNYVELGFNSVREFASQLPEIFHCIQPHDNTGDFKLYHAKSEIPSNQIEKRQKATNLNQLHHIYETSDEEALPVTVSSDTCKKLIPDEVLSMGECVGYLNVADLVKIEDLHIEVIVVEVFTPSFFWIQLRKKQNTFRKFMDDLHNFYVMNYELFVIPPVVLEEGLNCACMYNGIWHRAIIKTIKPDFQVTVLFYDYGTLKTYSPEEIYYLHRKFSYLPAQAIPCGLINIRPCTGSKWSRNATHLFAVKTSQIPLIATVASINIEDNSMMVTLTDTLGEEDVHINDWLVEKKLAEHGKMVDKVDLSSLLIYVEENLIFLPEKCYEEEINVSDCNKKNSSEEAINVPLISPQSTLMDDKLFKPSFEFTSRNEEQELLPKEETPDQIFQNNSMPTAFTASKNNANPFLQEVPIQNLMKDDINPQRFMQLWIENLTLQMQITSTLNILLESALLCNKEQTSTTVDFINTSITNTCGEIVPSTSNTCSSKNIGINHDFANVENFTFTPTNQQPLTTTFYNRNSDLNTYTDLFQNTNIQSATGNIGTTNSNSSMSTNSDFDTASQSLEDQKTSVKLNILPGCDKFVKTFKAGQQNYFGNSNTDLIPAENSINNKMPLKETNPFRLSLAGKLQISDSEEKDFLCTNSNSVVERDLISFEGNDSKVKHTNHNIFQDCKDTSLNHYIKTVRNNPFVLDYDSNIDNVTNAMSEINIDGQLEQYNAREVEMKRDCFSSSEKCFAKTSTCEITNENLTFASNYDTNNFSSSTLLPTDSLETPTLTDNVNINEEYLKHLNTSLYSKEHELQTVWKSTNIPEYLLSNYTVFFRLIELPSGIVHVFHHQEKGWLLTDEFVKICTKFKTTSDMKKLLYTLDICAHFKEIDRTKNLIKFLKSSSTLTKATQDVITGTGKLHLISLMSALKILHKLEIISQKNINNVFIHEEFTNGSIAHKIWLIVDAYKQLEEHLKSGQTCF